MFLSKLVFPLIFFTISESALLDNVDNHYSQYPSGTQARILPGTLDKNSQMLNDNSDSQPCRRNLDQTSKDNEPDAGKNKIFISDNLRKPENQLDNSLRDQNKVKQTNRPDPLDQYNIVADPELLRNYVRETVSQVPAQQTKLENPSKKNMDGTKDGLPSSELNVNSGSTQNCQNPPTTNSGNQPLSGRRNFDGAQQNLLEPIQGVEIKGAQDRRALLLKSPRSCYACTSDISHNCLIPDKTTTIKYCFPGHDSCVTRMYEANGKKVIVRDCAMSCNDTLDQNYKKCTICNKDNCNSAYMPGYSNLLYTSCVFIVISIYKTII